MPLGVKNVLVSYTEIFYSDPEERGKCGHGLKELRPTNRWSANFGTQ